VDRPETLTARFLNFFTRASSCASVFTASSMSQSAGHSPSESSASARKHLVLLEDIPNMLHPRVQESVHDAFRTFVETSSESASPCVIVVSDAGLRGESEDGAANSGRGKEVMDIRTIVPGDLLKGPFVTEVR
jgi:cell cycle checkpoint protein